MKKFTLILFLIVISLAGNADENSGIGLFTDRDVYASGETLLAKIYLPEDNSSAIVHLDLINHRGKQITGVSLVVKNKQADGYLYLPDSLSSGTYLLRTYFRNTSEKYSVVREIGVVNRFGGLEKTNSISNVENVMPLQPKQSDEIRFSGLDGASKTNSNIQVNVTLDEKLLEQLDGDLLISVARVVPQFESSVFQLGSANAKPGLTESRGIIYSGTVNDRKTDQPAANATVFLTIPDSIPGFQYYVTGDDGRFYFLIEHYYGTINAVLQCYSKDPAQRLKIVQDESFAAIGTMPVFSSVPVSDEFRKDIADCIDAVTFQKIFGQELLIKNTPPLRKTDDYAYYGVPSDRIDPQLFIDLPNFTEISRELLPGVKFRNYNNEPTLQVFNSPMRDYFSESPLILLDGIPIRDLNVIKDMGTNDIEWIEICKNERFYGDIRFAGVVAIYTTKADYSSLPETDQLIKLKAEAIQAPAQLAPPVVAEPGIPDLRQTLYWNVNAKPSKTLDVNFTTSNVQGHYRLVVSGKTADGTLIFSEKQFEVK